jgi:hypothetical protein
MDKQNLSQLLAYMFDLQAESKDRILNEVNERGMEVYNPPWITMRLQPKSISQYLKTGVEISKGSFSDEPRISIFGWGATSIELVDTRERDVVDVYETLLKIGKRYGKDETIRLSLSEDSSKVELKYSLSTIRFEKKVKDLEEVEDIIKKYSCIVPKNCIEYKRCEFYDKLREIEKRCRIEIDKKTKERIHDQRFGDIEFSCIISDQSPANSIRVKRMYDGYSVKIEGPYSRERIAELIGKNTRTTGKNEMHLTNSNMHDIEFEFSEEGMKFEFLIQKQNVEDMEKIMRELDLLKS